MVILSDVVTVLNKKSREADNRDGVKTTYYNLTIGGMGFSNNIGVPQEVYDSVDVGDDIRLKGVAGFQRDGSRFWYFNELIS